MIALLIAAGAAALLFWPKNTPTLPSSIDFLKPQQPAAPDGREAIDSLLAVRDRLAATNALDEDTKKAVDTLWLDLLHGSEGK